MVVLITDRKLFIYEFNREQSWDRWLIRKIKDFHILKMMSLCQHRHITLSETIQESEEATKGLKQSDTWKNNLKFSVYFKRYWLKSRRLSN